MACIGVRRMAVISAGANDPTLAIICSMSRCGTRLVRAIRKANAKTSVSNEYRPACDEAETVVSRELVGGGVQEFGPGKRNGHIPDLCLVPSI
jgi:hypothetical protein